MTPKSFDIDTAKEMLGDVRMRSVEAKARQDADNGAMDEPERANGTYWSRAQAEMVYTVYMTAHRKRLERIDRKGNK
jgi:hypothetical protein